MALPLDSSSLNLFFRLLFPLSSLITRTERLHWQAKLISISDNVIKYHNVLHFSLLGLSLRTSVKLYIKFKISKGRLYVMLETLQCLLLIYSLKCQLSCCARNGFGILGGDDESLKIISSFCIFLMFMPGAKPGLCCPRDMSARHDDIF